MRAKFIVTVFCLIMSVCMMCSAAQTAAVSYRMPQVGLSVDIPEEYDVFSADLSVYEAENAFSVSDEELMQYFEDNSILLEALSPDRNVDITFTGVGNVWDVDSFASLSDEQLRETADEIARTITDSAESVPGGVRLLEVRTERFSDTAVFAVIEYTAGGIYGMKYYTACNGSAVTMSVYVYDGMPDAYLVQTADSVAASFEFDSDSLLDPLFMSAAAGLAVTALLFAALGLGFGCISALQSRSRNVEKRRSGASSDV